MNESASFIKGGIHRKPFQVFREVEAKKDWFDIIIAFYADYKSDWKSKNFHENIWSINYETKLLCMVILNAHMVWPKRVVAEQFVLYNCTALIYHND